jgi:hypothetical protein
MRCGSVGSGFVPVLSPASTTGTLRPYGTLRGARPAVSPSATQGFENDNAEIHERDRSGTIRKRHRRILFGLIAQALLEGQHAWLVPARLV